MSPAADRHYLLDTNIVSEQWAKKPNGRVMAWLDQLNIERSYLSIMTLGEIRKGINRMDTGKKRIMLETWLTRDLKRMYEGHIIPIDSAIVDHWGVLLAEFRNNDVLDTLIAATAIVCDMTLVTRNERHFHVPGLKVINPWRAS
jgi:predicted nucleic acid-binding protein